MLAKESVVISSPMFSSPMPALPETRQPVPAQWELVGKEEPPAATITQEAQP